jgi:hypothetical protein
MIILMVGIGLRLVAMDDPVAMLRRAIERI